MGTDTLQSKEKLHQIATVIAELSHTLNEQMKQVFCKKTHCEIYVYYWEIVHMLIVSGFISDALLDSVRLILEFMRGMGQSEN